MIILNLLPKEERVICEQEGNYAIIKNSLYLFLVIFIFISVTILWARSFLEKNFSGLLENGSSSSSMTEIKNKIKEINKKLQKISGIQKDYFNFSYPLIEISKLLPQNVQINFLNLDKPKKQFVLSGYAKTRDDLLKFQKALEDSPLFANIKFPLDNLLLKENINFEFFGVLNTDENLLDKNNDKKQTK